MAIKQGDIAITGTLGGLTCYISRGVNIYRKASSLTGARVKKDPAFAGFRKSGNRMKEASPIDSSLYAQLPKDKKEFSLYRRLTGEALNMIKQGVEKEIIAATLYDRYIAPILEPAIAGKEPADRSLELKIYSSKKQTIVLAVQPLTATRTLKQQLSSSSSELIYLGRVKGCRRLKMWLRPNLVYYPSP